LYTAKFFIVDLIGLCVPCSADPGRMEEQLRQKIERESSAMIPHTVRCNMVLISSSMHSEYPNLDDEEGNFPNIVISFTYKSVPTPGVHGCSVLID